MPDSEALAVARQAAAAAEVLLAAELAAGAPPGAVAAVLQRVGTWWVETGSDSERGEACADAVKAAVARAGGVCLPRPVHGKIGGRKRKARRASSKAVDEEF